MKLIVAVFRKQYFTRLRNQSHDWVDHLYLMSNAPDLASDVDDFLPAQWIINTGGRCRRLENKHGARG